MCHQIWKVELEGEGRALRLLVRTGIPSGFDPPGEVPPGRPRPSCELSVDGRGEMTLNGWFNGKNVRPTSPVHAGETVRVGTAVFAIREPPVELTDGKPVPRPRFEARGGAGRLLFENLDPENIRIVGPADDHTFALDPARTFTIGIVPEADVQIIGASIGGRRNSRLQFDAARGSWTLLHLKHGCPIYVNGQDITHRDEVPLRDGDCFEPGGQAGVHIRFYEQG